MTEYKWDTVAAWKPRLVYILIYIVVAQLFYIFMQKPWDNCALEASGAAAGVQLASKGCGVNC